MGPIIPGRIFQEEVATESQLSVLLVDLVVPTQEKDFEILEGGIIMITICIIKTVVEVMMMKMLGTKILDQIMMILVTQHMEVDQEEKKTELVEPKVDLVAPKDVVEDETV